MTIIINTELVTATSPGITTAVSDILECVSQDVRAILQPTTDATLLVDYTNRISMDILRYSRWKFLLSAPQEIQTVLGQTDYWIGPTGGGPNDTGLDIDDLGSIKRDSVIDYTNFHKLGQTGETPIGAVFSKNGKPALWRNDSSTPFVLNIYPPADNENGQSYRIQFRYYKPRVVLTSPTQIIQIPDIYKDVVCAGVNMLSFKYLHQDEDVQYWNQAFQQGKMEMVKDKNLFPAGGDFIRPDSATVQIQTVSGVGLDSGLESSLP
jgi:hypothetical protein